MKKLLSLFLAAFFCLLTGCGNSSNSSQSGSAESDTPSSYDYSVLSDDLFSYDILLDGVKYTLPADYSEFEANGWTLSEEDSQETLIHNQYILNIDLKNGSKKITAQFINSASESKTLNECKVGAVMAFGKSGSSKLSLILPKGITFGSSLDDVKNAYGEPIKTDTSADSYDSYLYKIDESDDYSEVKIMISKDKSTVSGINIKNLNYQ